MPHQLESWCLIEGHVNVFNEAHVNRIGLMFVGEDLQLNDLRFHANFVYVSLGGDVERNILKRAKVAHDSTFAQFS